MRPASPHFAWIRSFLAASFLIAASAHADQVLVNFGASAYTSDGSNTWQTFDLHDGSGQFAALTTTGLLDTSGAPSGITLEITGAVFQNGPTGPWNGVFDNAGASQGQFDAPASGTKPVWFDSSSFQQRQTFGWYDYDITYTFSGFSASDTIQFDFAVGVNLGLGDRALTLSYPPGSTTLMNDVQVANVGRYATIPGLTGSTSYSFVARSTGHTSGALVNALAVTSDSGGPDTTKPTLSGTDPADGATGIATTANLAATFSENIQAGTGNIELRKTTGGALVEAFDVTTAPSARLTFSGATVTINPSSDLEIDVDYYLLIPATAVEDGAGNAFDGISDPTAWNFTASAPVVTSPDIVINEVHYDANPKTERVEFVELLNRGTTTVDLSGWRLAGVGDYLFPGGSILSPGGYLVVAEDPTTMLSKFGVSTAHQYAGSLSNGGDDLRLRDAAGAEIDRVDYRAGFPWPTTARGAGPSMELLHPDLDNDTGGSWRSSTGAPSPGAVNSVFTLAAPPQARQVEHSPGQPTPGQAVTVSAKVTDPDGVASVTLSYQSVAPGGYIALDDAAYQTTWTDVPMLDDGTAGDALAADDTYTVTMPAALQLHRRLLRYRITVSDAQGNNLQVPYPDDESPNFAYFCYDSVPAWNGADQPGSTAPQTFSADLMDGALPVYHLIADATDVTNSQYVAAFDGVRMRGTLVYDGKVYDHIQFYNRGEASTYRSGKNKWRIKFNRARDFEARDIYGGRYETTWKTMNLNACASPWMPVNRGMAGFDEAVPHRLYQLAGVPSSNTHWLQFRVVDAADETPADQYAGDLWGLYLAVEHPDGRFLDEHGLPDGNTYKVSRGGLKKNQGPTQPLDDSDWDSFWSASANLNTVAWWRDNFDLAGYYGFRAINRASGNVDLREVTNHYMYHHPDGRWKVMPWDLDMMYIPAVHNTGVVRPDSCLGHTEISIEFKNRCRELLDLLFADIDRHGGQAAQVVEELASVVHPTGNTMSMVDVDQFLWNYHPRTAADHSGQFYVTPKTQVNRGFTWLRTLPTPDHEGCQQRMIDYMYDTDPDGFAVGDGDQRGYGFNYLSQEAGDNAIPARPTITYSGDAGFPTDGLSFTSGSFSDPQGAASFASMQWRVGEISNPDTASFVAGEPWAYEVEEVWGSGQLSPFTAELVLPVGALRPGHTYRARVRHFDSSGRASHWAEPFEFTASLPDVTTYLDGLVISEIMYNPVGDDAREFVEIMNIGPTALDLSDVRFTKGIDFDFAGSAITSIAPGARVLVVKNRSAFEAVHGTGLPVAGEYQFSTSDSLNNGGERLKLSFGAGTAIRDFEYDDVHPWPESPDGDGPSLVLIDPMGNPDHTQASNWRPSTSAGGNPNTTDAVPFSGVATDDLDFDGISALMEHALASSDSDPDLTVLPTVGVGAFAATVGGPLDDYLTFTYRNNLAADDLIYTVQIADDVTAWSSDPGDVVFFASDDTGSGYALVTYRSAVPIGSALRQFMRLKISTR
jgi:hypothetical protein